MIAALVNNESTTSVAAAYRAGYMPSSSTPPKPSPTALFRQLGLCSGADLLALTAHNVTSVVEITNLFLPHLARSPSGAACVVNLVSPRCSTAEAARSSIKSLSTMAFDASQAALAMVCAYQTAHLSACASPTRRARLISMQTAFDSTAPVAALDRSTIAMTAVAASKRARALSPGSVPLAGTSMARH